MQITENHKVAKVVRENLAAAEIFDSHNIDFCCGGNKSIQEACQEQGVNPANVISELHDKMETADPGTQFISRLNAGELCDYIEKRHHAYVTESIPGLQQYLDKVCDAHGDKHPEVYDVREFFNQSAGQLSQHMKKEELILFPIIRKMQKALNEGEPVERPHFGSIDNPISMMREEHANEGARFEKIAEITGGFTVPDDACNTFRYTYHKLQEFEKDLHRHIHLENNVLFPDAIRMQEKIFGNE